MNIQDLVHGVDFTGINPATGGDHNNIVDLAAPVADSASTGKGLVLWTIDQALDTPTVPDPTGIGASKWKRYLWVRIPYQVGVPFPASITPLLYAWNEARISVPTYLKWVQIVADTAALQAQITAVVNQLATIQSTAVNAQTIANQANTTANQANTNSQNAINQIAGAVTTANAAKTAADGATAAVATLTADLNTLQQTVSTIETTSIPTLTNLVRSCAICSEQANAGVDLGNTAAGQNTRTINTKNYDPQNLITLGGGKITFNVAGTFKIRAVIPWSPGISGADYQHVQCYIKKDSDNSLLLQGHSHVANVQSAAGFTAFRLTMFTEVVGVITVVAGTTVRVDMHAEFALGKLGYSAIEGPNFPGGAFEVYTVVDIQQLM